MKEAILIVAGVIAIGAIGMLGWKAGHKHIENQEHTGRFQVTQKGIFNQICILKDTKTGKEYIWVQRGYLEPIKE